MTTVFLTALEVQKHLKNAFKISKEYYFPQKNKNTNLYPNKIFNCM